MPAPALPPPDDDRPLVAVATTNVFCRAGCPAPAPRASNAERLASAREALFAGYRPCLRCRPLASHGRGVTAAELRHAELLRPTLASARRARRRRTGTAAVVLSLITTPLGRMLAGVNDDGVCLLEFSDRPMLPTQLSVVARRLRLPLVAGRHRIHDRLQAQLDEYFAGRRGAFDLPIVAPGSPFQRRVWDTLRTIPTGGTLSYEALAARVGRPQAQRAVGTANGANRLALVIPCHRVIRKTGETGNYGGGRWRKAWLLAHERAMAAGSAVARLPGSEDPDLVVPPDHVAAGEARRGQPAEMLGHAVGMVVLA